MLDLALSLFIPPELAPWSAAFLAALSTITSALTGALGLGGGILMLVVLAQLLPPIVVIPVHAIVQVGSNAGRAALMREHIAWPLVLPFIVGAAIGAGAGAAIVTALPGSSLQIVLAVFVVWSAWAPKLKPARLASPWFVLVGLFASFAAMFIGAAGPLVAAFLVPDPLTRHQVIATHAMLMTLLHTVKIGAFTAIGFAFLPWLPLLLVMIGFGFLGTLLGRLVLDRMREQSFALAFKLVLSALALKVGFDGVTALLG